MLSLDFVSNFLYSNLQKTTMYNMEFTARCPFCGDSKKDPNKRRFHLKYINEESSVFNCFNCGTTGTFYDLYAHINGLTLRETFKILKTNGLEELRNKNKKVKKEELVKDEPVINNNEFSYILKDCLSLSDIPDGIVKQKYYEILKRFYDDRCIDSEFKLYIAFRGIWKNRIIIPIYDGNRLVYFQGRAINNKTDIKYKNPISEKKNIILNKDKFNNEKNIIITEGILDALSIGNQATVCMGASISDDFIRKLYDYTNKKIIVALDNDKTGIKNTLKLIENSKYKNEINYFVMPNKYKHIKDLNELKTKELGDNIYDFVVDNSHSSLKAYILLKQT